MFFQGCARFAGRAGGVSACLSVLDSGRSRLPENLADLFDAGRIVQRGQVARITSFGNGWIERRSTLPERVFGNWFTK